MSACIENVAQSTTDFNMRIENLLGEQKTKSNPEPEVLEDTRNAKKTMAAVLLDLTTIAAQLAHVDMTIAKVNDGAPEDPEAKRWHDISIQALRTSRNMLSEKQLSCINELSALAGVPAAPLPKTEPEQKSKEPSTWDAWTDADIAACPEFVPPPPGLEQAQFSSDGSLRKDLEILRHAQPETVFIVRRIKKLGFESPQMLRQHFGQYGLVQEILVAHSHVKPTPKRPNGRVRPAALGFVIMASPEDVKKAFEAGDVHDVQGCPIELKAFESFDRHYAGEEGVADEN